MNQSKPVVTTITEDQTFDLIGRPYSVILFNDQAHEMGEVVIQIRKATGFSAQQAEAIMFAAHQSGRAVVITTGKERAEHVAAVLDQIQLGTQIEEA